MNAYDVTITTTVALLFNTATACTTKANAAYYTGKHNPKMMDRMASRALDSAARELGIHRDDIMPVYNLHRGLPIAIGKHIVRPV